MKQRHSATLATLLSLLTIGTAFAQQPPPIDGVPVKVNVYAVKFLCGSYRGPATPGAQHEGPVKPGNYLTAINIHNPNTGSVPFRKKGLLLYRADIPPQGFETPMPPGPFFQAKLEPDWGMEIDCADIREVLLKDHPQGPVPPPTFIKGFVVIEMPASGPNKANIPLDVTAVYTSHGYKVDPNGILENEGFSIDVEKVTPTLR